MSEQKMSGKLTPPGTRPGPVRRNTKHKRPEYGVWLMAKHKARQQRRTQSHLDVRRSDGAPRCSADYATTDGRRPSASSGNTKGVSLTFQGKEITGFMDGAPISAPRKSK